ncbi:MAG TPA: DUF3048 domain-containing protein [Chloroflexia bacterium]|nr:DUF3048 domain-containing protein [Chloroflexia bacterium]
MRSTTRRDARASATPATAGPPRATVGKLLAWFLIPSLLALVLAGLGLALLAGGSSPLPGSTVSAVIATPALTASSTLGAQAVELPPSATPTLDRQALTLLTQLPATMPPDLTASAVPAIPTDPADGGDTSALALATLPAAPPTLPATAEAPLPATIPALAPTATALPGPTEIAALPPDPAPGAVDPITGLPADPAKVARVPIVVMIDNHPDAAPQTGLNAASMVFEALAEGGITRFETFFLSGDAPTVGPVRSARPYFVEWAYPFQPLYVHCGGSWEAIDLIREASSILTNVDCFDGNMPFWRSNDRLMPHNLYSSTTQLWKMADRRGLTAPSAEPGFLHTAPLPPDQRPDSASLSFYFSLLSRSDITWVYDHDTNRYLRKQWGAWHRDLDTGEIINARNVVVLWTNVWELPGDEKGRMGTDTVGQGTALILHDGQFEWGYWARKTPYTPLAIYDGKWQPMRFVPGRIWFEVLGIGKKVQIGH